MQRFKPYAGNGKLANNLIHANIYYIADQAIKNLFYGMLLNLRYQGYQVKFKAVTI